MKRLRLNPFLAFSTGFLSGQETKTSPLDESPILDEVAHKNGNHTLVIQRIEQPNFETAADKERKTQRSPQRQDRGGYHRPAKTFLVSAQSYGRHATKLTLWPSDRGQDHATEYWSNIDWELLTGLFSFEAEDSEYQIMLFHSKSGKGKKSSEIPRELPKFAQAGARYLAAEAETAEDEEALDFLEGVHRLYEENRKQLRKDRAIAIKRQKERLHHEKIEAKKPKTRILKIWRHQRDQN